ncbi:MAG: hypothetical protein ACMXYF_01615 [Candidatus Woesearchaeota archaeon]
MRPLHQLPLFSWIHKYSGQEIDLYTSNNDNKTMLEEVIIASVSTAGVCAATGIGYVCWLSHLQKKAEKNSPKLNSEAQAEEYFRHLLRHYELAEDNFELRLKYDGFDYLRRDSEKKDAYVVFLNMKKGTTKARIRHELLHYINGDLDK